MAEYIPSYPVFHAGEVVTIAGHPGVIVAGNSPSVWTDGRVFHLISVAITGGRRKGQTIDASPFQVTRSH